MHVDTVSLTHFLSLLANVSLSKCLLREFQASSGLSQEVIRYNCDVLTDIAMTENAFCDSL